MDTTTTEEPYYADEKALDGEYDEDEYDEGIVENNNLFYNINYIIIMANFNQSSYIYD